jgi:hypothetical protein
MCVCLSVCMYAVCLYVLLHTRFPGEHDLCIVLHFHGNVTVLLRNSGFVAFPW